jgi:hypothetical protein
VFDLLRRDEDDLTEVPLSQRKQLLMRLVGRDFACLHPVQTFEGGANLLEAAERHGLEGILSKRKASPYRSGPSRDWVNTKTAPFALDGRDRIREAIEAGTCRSTPHPAHDTLGSDASGRVKSPGSPVRLERR